MKNYEFNSVMWYPIRELLTEENHNCIYMLMGSITLTAYFKTDFKGQASQQRPDEERIKLGLGR